jgi:phosphate acyltransferase
MNNPEMQTGKSNEDYEPIKVALDSATAEQGHLAAMKGGLIAMKENPRIRVIFVGEQDKLESGLEQILFQDSSLIGLVDPEVDFVFSENHVEMDDSPLDTLEYRKSSHAICARLVDTGRADIFVSPGNSGASALHAWVDVALLDSVNGNGTKAQSLRQFVYQKPGIIARVPNSAMKREVFICDSGASTDSSPANLADNSLVLSLYLRRIEGILEPRIALLNLGSEAGKGNKIYRRAAKIMEKLSETGFLNFVGNKEPKDMFLRNVADGYISDAQLGNGILKTAEAVYETLLGQMKESYKSQPFIYQALGLPVMRGMKKQLKRMGDMKRLGGAFMPMARYPVIIAHGAAGEEEIAGSVLYAAKVAKINLAGDIEKILNEARPVYNNGQMEK